MQSTLPTTWTANSLWKIIRTTCIYPSTQWIKSIKWGSNTLPIDDGKQALKSSQTSSQASMRWIARSHKQPSPQATHSIAEQSAWNLTNLTLSTTTTCKPLMTSRSMTRWLTICNLTRGTLVKLGRHEQEPSSTLRLIMESFPQIQAFLVRLTDRLSWPQCKSETSRCGQRLRSSIRTLHCRKNWSNSKMKLSS